MKQRSESVWCIRFLAPDHQGIGIDVPGWVGGEGGELCEACEQLRLRALSLPTGEEDETGREKT